MPAEITAWVATLDPVVGACFCGHLELAQEAVGAGVTPSNARAAVGMWKRWLVFCDELGLEPFLDAFKDTVCLGSTYNFTLWSG